MDELRSWFEVPAIAHYFHVFRDAFDLIDFDIEDFEETLLIDGSNNVSSFIPDIVIRLLRGLYKTKDGLQVTLENHGHYLHDLLNFHYGVLQKKENPLINSTFKELSMRQKVEIIYDMINWRLDLEDAMELTKNLEGDEMRVEPVGKDSDGCVYWYFYGSRLYKEGGTVDDSQDESETAAETKPAKKAKKRKKKPVAQTRSGRAIRKRKNSTSDESGEESEKSVEVPDNESSSPRKKPSSKNSWSVACSTNEMWRTLMDSLRGTTSRNEKQLLANLEELYTTIPAIIKARDEKVQKKLLAMAPRRVSDRITYRMQLKEEEERAEEQERLLKKQQKMKEDEEKQKKIEAEKAEEREKRYKEREKTQEQRALRAKMREEQKHVRVNPELGFASSPTPSTPNSMIKTENDRSLSSDPEEEEEDNEYTSMSIVLEAIKEHDDAWLFLQPVKEEEAPNYYTFIKNPMDFQTIGEKIKKKIYKDKYDFENDVLLVFDNCETYNGTYSPFTKLAFKVKKQFHKVMKREFPKDIHEDDDDFFQSDDQPSKPKKSRVIKSNTPPQPMTKSYLPQQQKKERKPRKEKVFASAPADSSTPKMPAARTKPIHHIYQKPPVTQLSPISATNFLSTRFGIPPNVLKQMSPAQMQSLILRYPRAGFVPALQGLMGNKLNANPTNQPSVGGAASNTVVGTTTLSPLHQLANTALAPTSAPSAPSVSIALPILPKSVPPGGANAMNKQQSIRSFNPGHVQSTLGRPRKTSITPTAPVPAAQLGSGYVSGLSVSGVPVTIQWDELKKQLMAQMIPAASTTTTAAAGQASKYVSGVTVSGAPITIEWEELKKQLVSQMKKDESPAAPLNKETIAMSLLHLNSGANTVVSMATPSTTMSGIPSLKSNIVTMASPAGGMAGIPSLRPNLAALAAASGIPNIHSNVVTIAPSAGSAGSVLAAAGMTVTPNILRRPGSETMASTNAIPGIPSLRPVSIPAGEPLRFTKDAGVTTTTTPANTKMFSFSNILNNKLPTSSPIKPVTIKTPTIDTTNLVENNVPTTAPVSPLSAVRLQSGHAKVQDWLKSSSPFIAQNADNAQPISSKVTSTFQNIVPGDSKINTGGIVMNGKTPSLRFISAQVPPQQQTTSQVGAMEYVPRPSFLATTNTTASASKLVPIALPNVHHIVTTISNNGINLLPMKTPVASQGKIVAASAANIAAVTNKSNLLDLQKAALQAAAVNQISSKLQNHLKKDQQKEKLDLFNHAIKDTTGLAASTAAAKPAPKKNETLTFLKQNEVLMSSSNIVAANQIALNVAPSVILNQLNNIPANQLLTSANLLTSSGTAGSVPVGQPRILIMPNRSINETAPTAVTFPSTGLVNIQPGRPVVAAISSSDATAPKVLVNAALPSTTSSVPFVKAPIPIQIPQSLNSQIITTLVPTTKYVTFATKPVAGQPTSQMSKLIVPSVPALSKITTPQTVRFQTISSDVPAIQPKVNATNKQFVVQQRAPGQGQTVRYILPAQTQLPGGQIINLNQLGSVQNLFINNVPIAKNQSTKSVRIVSGNLSNGIAKSAGSKIIVTPSLGAPAAVLANATQVKANEAIVMRSPVKVGMTSDNIRPQLAVSQTTTPVITIASNIHSKKLDSNQTLVISNNALTNTSGVSNFISIPKQTVVPLRPNIVQKIEVNTPNGSPATVRHPLIIQSTPKLSSATILPNNNKSTIRQTVPAVTDARKLLPKTTIASPSVLVNGGSTPSGVTAAATTATLQTNQVKSPPDGEVPKTVEKQKHVVLDPTQLQKLKEEGRIIMTPTGQLIMIPPNLVGKVPGSVFK